MKPCKRILVLLFVCSQSVFAQDAKERLQQYFTALRDNQQFNGNVLVAERGKIIYEQSFGYSDFEKQRFNFRDIQFPIASVSKTIVATAILQLVQAGKLRVEDPVVKYLPAFPYETITIRHLLSHTSGLPTYNAYFDSLHRYTSRVKREIMSSYIQQHILTPAGMRNTKFFPLKQQYAQEDNPTFAFPHLYPHLYSDSLVIANKVPYVAAYWHAYNFTGFGDYISTTRDLLKYDKALYDGKLLNAATLNEAFQPVLLNNGKPNPGYFGLGWEIEEDSSLGKVVYHSGAATGHSCVLLRNISRHQTIILFDNTHYNAHAMASGALKALNSGDYPYPKKSIASIYGKVLLKSGAAAARDTLFKLRADTAHYLLSEDELNSLGYDFMAAGANPFHFPEVRRYAEAIETLKLNTELFPSSWNVYDSYGEAIRMYRKSVELNPGNTGGKKALQELQTINIK